MLSKILQCRQIFMQLIVTCCFMPLIISCESHPKQTMLEGPPFEKISWNEIGKIQARKSTEISGSNLWIGCEVLDRDYADYHAYKSFLPELGAKKARIQSGWAKTEKVKGVYDFQWLDEIVDDLISKDIEPWVQISYGNTLYPGAGGIGLGEGLPHSEEGLEAWRNYTVELVSHFKDRVKEWEVWNEADHGYNASSGVEYAQLYYQTATIIRELQPDSKIVALSLAYAGRTDFVLEFFEFLKQKSALYLVDVVSFHGYPANPDDGFPAIAKLEELVHSYNPAIELWQGETGCPSTLETSGALKQHPWSEKMQAKWNLRRALAHLGRGYPYTQFTISEYVYNTKLFSGLNGKGLLKIHPDKSIDYPKPAYFAYQHLTAILDEEYSLLEKLNYQSRSNYNMSAFGWKHINGNYLLAIWLDGSKPTETDWYIPIDFEFENMSFNDPVLVDVRTGQVFEIPAEKFQMNGQRLEIKGLLVYDSPIIVMERASVL
jgi:hypothetical protein